MLVRGSNIISDGACNLLKSDQDRPSQANAFRFLLACSLQQRTRHALFDHFADRLGKVPASSLGIQYYQRGSLRAAGCTPPREFGGMVHRTFR